MSEADGGGRPGGGKTGSDRREQVGPEREAERPVRAGDAAERERPVPVPESDEALLAECRIETFRAGGPGGQHQNTTESAVRLVHLPTGTRVIARDERSQHRNRALALDRLRRALEERNRVQAPRVETRVPRAERRKRLEQKRRRGQKKRLRRPPEPDGE